jgi:hypothetical protein
VRQEGPALHHMIQRSDWRTHGLCNIETNQYVA